MITVGSPYWLYMSEQERRKKIKKIAEYVTVNAYSLERACALVNISPSSLTHDEINYIRSLIG